MKTGLDTNHGSLGLISELNHSSASSRYPFKAGSIHLPTKHSRPKVLIHDGLNLMMRG